MKLLASTTGNFMLVSHPDQIEPDRASVISNSGFWHQRISLGQVKVHGELNDDASDEGFAKLLKEAVDKAGKDKKARNTAVKAVIDGYCRDFAAGEPVEPKPAPEPSAPPAPPAPPAT